MLPPWLSRMARASRETGAMRATSLRGGLRNAVPEINPGPLGSCNPSCSLVTLPGALLGLGVVVAALQRDPVRLDVLAARQVVRPCVAGHQAVGLPDDVELPVGAHFADQHRL